MTSSDTLARPLLRRLALAAVLAPLALLGGCGEEGGLSRNARHFTPIPAGTMALMSERQMTKSAPILIRAFKKEAELEVWKMDDKGDYALLKTYPICRWSGQLGPKQREGDRQTPEGFYPITAAQMNPNSNYYLSFDTGFPNAVDRANGRTGRYVMVHGACSSAGCFSMTDAQVAEIYALVREAHSGGQRAVQMQSFPFRMTAENLAKARHDPNLAFWRNLKEGSDRFEVTRKEPQVGACGRKYVFDSPKDPGTRLDAAAPCPALTPDPEVAALVAHKQADDAAAVSALVAKGARALKLVYDDGGQHASFRATNFAMSGGGSETALAYAGPRTISKIAEVSRPEALENGPREIEVAANGRPVQVASASPTATVPALPANPITAKAAASKLATKPVPAEAARAAAKAGPLKPAPAKTVAEAAPAEPAPKPDRSFLARAMSFVAE